MTGYRYGFGINRESEVLDVFIDYQIDGYEDPETGEYFDATNWSFSLSGDGSGGGGGSGGEYESVYLPFGMPRGRVDFSLNFHAQNSFSAVSISFDLDFHIDAYTTQSIAMRGGARPDVLISGSGDDTLAGQDGNDHLDAGAGNDRLVGGSGGDTLQGLLGADTMVGGEDGDLYYVDDAGDVVIESGEIGIDAVVATIDNYVLGANIENMSVGGLLSTSGNALANLIYGSYASDTIDGADGNDTIHGFGGGDSIAGGSGDDWLLGGVGLGATRNTTLSGGEGNDTLSATLGGVSRLVGGAGADHLVGNGGLVWASYAGAATAVRAELAVSAANLGDALGDTYSGIGNLLGSSFADTLGGDSETNLLTGGAGDDALAGLAANDTLEGGVGGDALNGGDGLDAADYHRAASAVRADLRAPAANAGEAEGDTYVSIEHLFGSAHDDTLSGDLQGNRLDGRDGDDSLLGGDGDDTLNGGAGLDTIDGGVGIDTLSYRGAVAAVRGDLLRPSHNGGAAAGDLVSGFENLTGGAHDDTLRGDHRANLVYGAGGNDRLLGRGGDDSLIGGDFHDTLIGGGGGDLLLGGNGVDTIDYRASAGGVAIDLAARWASGGDAEGDVLRGIENVVGSRFDDTLLGTQESYASDELAGGGGNDILDGRAGPDILNGGAGADTIDGGDYEGWAYDILRYTGDTQGVSVDLGAGIGAGGDAQGDIFTGFEIVEGGAGNDTLTGDSDDFARYNYLHGGAGNDIINGYDDASATYSAIDEIFGDAGDDTLIGGQRNGFTHMTGGTGADTFVVVRETAFLYQEFYEDILDFEAGIDRIALTRDGSLGASIGAVGALAASAFRLGATAADADDRIIYDAATGRLWFDSDGAGGVAQVQIAQIANRAALDAGDFFVI